MTLPDESISKPKLKVLLFYIVYPLAMGTYFKRALERRTDIDLVVTGPYTGNWIPWQGGMTLPDRYAKNPHLPLPFQPNVGRVNYEFVEVQLQGWKPDLIITVDAGINWAGKPQGIQSVTVGTDPHVLDYSHARKISDKFFNMQLCYSEKDDIYLPYAYDPTVHYRDENQEVRDLGNGYSVKFSHDMKEMDAVLIGMPYENRVRWKDELRKHGVFMYLENGPVFDEYRALASRAKIGCTWSSMNDLIARFFETPAFGLPMVANRVPDAPMFLEEDEDYLAFSTLPEAVEKVLYLKNNPDKADQIAQKGYERIQGHTYDTRVSKILKECGYG